VKKACDEADSKGVASGINNGKEQEGEIEVDLNVLPKKERIKIINQRARDAKKAIEKVEKEAQKAKEKAEKEAKKGERSCKSKTVVVLIPLLLLT
jgi:hypothetical protein